MGLRILIAEEEDSFRGHIVRALDGHHVVEAASGAEALESLRGEPFPLVITGMEMGDVSGLALMEQAKSLDPGALVVVTIDPARAPEAARALRSGAHDYLFKSCEDDVLAAVLRRAIEQVTLVRENQALLNSLKRNVEALGRQNQRLEHLATRDGLTGLYNHRYFREAFEVELSRCRRHGRVISLVSRTSTTSRSTTTPTGTWLATSCFRRWARSSPADPGNRRSLLAMVARNLSCSCPRPIIRARSATRRRSARWWNHTRSTSASPTKAGESH